MTEKNNKINKTKEKTIKKSGSISSLETKLKSADPEIVHYVSELKKENLNLLRKVGELEATNTVLENKNTITKERLKKCCVHGSTPYKCLKEAEEKISAEIKKLEKE